MGWAADILPFYRAVALELPNPCTVVEVGSAHGRSAIFLAQELIKLGHGSQSKIYMVDDWGGGWFAECLPSLVKHAEPRELELLRPLRVTSELGAKLFSRVDVDMVFIDGDHSRIGCASDLETWWSVCRSCGIFAGHDYDAAAHPGVVAAVDEWAENMTREIQRPTRSVWRLR
jgi:predicted O-methyltransferase YrrM